MPPISAENKTYDLSGTAQNGPGFFRRILHQITTPAFELEHGGTFSLNVQVVEVTPQFSRLGVNANGILEFHYQLLAAALGEADMPLGLEIRWQNAQYVHINYADSLNGSTGLLAPSQMTYQSRGSFIFHFAAGVLEPANSRQFFVRTNATKYSPNSSQAGVLNSKTEYMFRLPGPSLS